MLTPVLRNVCLPISLLNKARFQAIDIVPDKNNISDFYKVYYLANNYSNLLLNGFKHCFVYLSF